MTRQLGSVVDTFSGGPGAQQYVPPVGSGTSQPEAPKYIAVQQASLAKQLALPRDVFVGGQGFSCAEALAKRAAAMTARAAPNIIVKSQ